MRVYIILLILLIVFVLMKQGIKEHFAFALFTKKKFFVENTSMYPIVYSKCIGMPSSDNRVENAPFYLRSFINVRYTLHQIANLLRREVNKLDNATVAAVLINNNSTSNQNINVYFLFPEFNNKGIKEESYALIAKNHRWYYLLMYNLFYNAGNGLCGSTSNFGVCPGTFIRVRSKNYFVIRYIDYYITPCGASGVSGIRNPLIPYVNNSELYAHYIPKSYIVPNITTYPNLAYMSQYDTIKYGCDSQLVSEDRSVLLLLDQPTRRFGVYRVTYGDVYAFCALGSFPFKKPIWTIPLSFRSRLYATFKLEANYIVLVDYDRPIFKITIPTQNTPIVLKLSNRGDFEIYDSTNKFIRIITYEDIMAAIRGEKVKDIEIDLDTIRYNLSQDDIRRRELEERARRAEAAENEAIKNYNNRCPIGS